MISFDNIFPAEMIPVSSSVIHKYFHNKKSFMAPPTSCYCPSSMYHNIPLTFLTLPDLPYSAGIIPESSPILSYFILYHLLPPHRPIQNSPSLNNLLQSQPPQILLLLPNVPTCTDLLPLLPLSTTNPLRSLLFHH